MKGHTRRHGKGWAYVLDIGPDPATGKRRQRWKGGFERQKDAQAALTVVLAQLNDERFVETTTMTVRSFLVDEWLPSREHRVRPSTLLSYRQVLEGRVVPRLGALELRKLRPKHIADLYRELLTSGGRDARRGPGLSARTVRYTGMVLTRALDDAVRLGYLSVNPAKLVERPRPRAVEMKVWNAAEARQFLEHVREDRLFALWALYLTAGLRRGEALGLRWGDVELDAGRLAVRRTLVSVDGKAQWSEPKTDKSRRVVALDTEIVAVLRAHRTRQLEERLAVGPGYRDDDLVFCTVSGTVLHPDNVTNMFDRHVAAARLPRIRLHDLRHTAATLLLEAGVNVKVVSERFGHSSIAITGDLYQHVAETLQADAAEKAGRTLLGP